MSLLALIPGVGALLNPIATITSKIADAKIELAKAETDEKRIAAKERVDTLEARKAVMIAESGSRVNAFMRAALAAPVAFLLWKVLVYDKALGQWTQGRTDALDDNLWKVVAAVIGFYFLYEVTTRLKR